VIDYQSKVGEEEKFGRWWQVATTHVFQTTARYQPTPVPPAPSLSKAIKIPFPPPSMWISQDLHKKIYSNIAMIYRWHHQRK